MKPKPDISIVVCTYNPTQHRIDATMHAIGAQSLPPEAFEVLVVDNASKPALIDTWGLSNLRVTIEPKQGLTQARLRGVLESRAPVVVFVDDDNLLTSDYLSNVLASFTAEPQLGAIGGRIDPVWEGGSPPLWMNEFFGLLALRDLGEKRITEALGSPPVYPPCSPVGAGMAVRREALATWIEAASTGLSASDRTGSSLTSGGDNDIVLHILRAGWKVGYEPKLRMQHIIPENRLDPSYLGRLAEAIMISWIQTLDRHGIRPWPKIPSWTLPLRRSKAYFTTRAWSSTAGWIRWKAACGTFAGQARLNKR
jgi:glycosyltransferase involved in cell wall biosynthesis